MPPHCQSSAIIYVVLPVNYYGMEIVQLLLKSISIDKNLFQEVRTGYCVQKPIAVNKN